jgi:hypothetical protein
MAVEHGKAQIHPQPRALEHGRKVPRIDAVPVDGRSLPGGVPPSTENHRRRQGMAGQRLVKPSDRAGGPGE